MILGHCATEAYEQLLYITSCGTRRYYLCSKLSYELYQFRCFLENKGHCQLEKTMGYRRLLRAYTAINLFTTCLAGLQAPILIINLSTQDVLVNLDTPGDNCIYYDFDDTSTQRYMTAYTDSDLEANYGDDDNDYTALNSYLQLYKTRIAIPDLSTGVRGNTGSYTLSGLAANQPVSFAFQAVEMKGSGNCLDSHSVWTFSTTANGTTMMWGLNDPATSHWYITAQNLTDGTTTSVDIGSGGHANFWLVAIDAVLGTLSAIAICTGIGAIVGGIIAEAGTFAAITLADVASGLTSTTAAFGGLLITVGGTSITGIVVYNGDPDTDGGPDQEEIDSINLYGIADIYNTVASSDLSACLIGKNIIGNFDCMAA